MNNEINLSPFEEAIDRPDLQMKKYLSCGKQVIGCFPLYVPEQLVYAAGMIPFGMWGATHEINQAKRYFPAYVCGLIQTNFELGINGKYKGMSGVVIPLLCDTLKCATQNWKYAVPDIPVIPITYPQNRKSLASSSFLREQYLLVKTKLEEISGNVISEKDIYDAIEIYNTHNCVMRDFVKLAAQFPEEITPKMRSVVIKSGFFMDKAEHTRLVREFVGDLSKKKSERFRGIKVVTTGIIADNSDLLDIMKKNKIAIVADAVDHESGQFRVNAVYEGNGIDALVKQYLGLFGHSTIIGGDVSREEYLVRLVRESKADGVIVFLTKFCDPEEYDYPQIKRRLEAEGIPLLSIEVDSQIKNYSQAATALMTFQEMIRL